jgi:hypothetical protein
MERNRKKTRLAWGIFLLVLGGLLLGGCASFGPKQPEVLVSGKEGMVVYKEKYEFKTPYGWALLQNVSGGDFEFGFFKKEEGAFPSQTSFVYDPEPFGSSPDLKTRSEQYCTRFLFNSGIIPKVQKEEQVQVMGLPALVLILEGKNPYRDEKSRSKIYLVKKGDRIISFVCTQWRPINAAFSEEPFQIYNSFVDSFKFLKKPFYESFEERMKKAGL